MSNTDNIYNILNNFNKIAKDERLAALARQAEADRLAEEARLAELARLAAAANTVVIVPPAATTTKAGFGWLLLAGVAIGGIYMIKKNRQSKRYIVDGHLRKTDKGKVWVDHYISGPKCGL